jgi:serine/threonine-protein kinase
MQAAPSRTSQSASLDAQRWNRLEEVFLDALERDVSGRHAFVVESTKDDPSLAPEVEAMLAAHEESLALALEAQLIDAPSHHDVPEILGPDVRIGPYRLVEHIGRGGMGDVFRAERVDGEFTQTVAIKLLRTNTVTPEVLRRFRFERQVLARLEHAHIARLIDGALTPDGRPYLVMELVGGRPITAYCDEARLAIDARLALFRTVCGAVQYAHRHLIVHRDLKPSNILVTASGDVKLLDFGLAKLLAPDESVPANTTQTTSRVLTPDYASPEQVRGERITTATDVYALGLLLYELLSGVRAQTTMSASLVELERRVCIEEPPRPSDALASGTREQVAARVAARGGGRLDRLRRHLRDELDTIVASALRKDPSRRYSSVEQLSDDVGRHVSGLPVLARADTFGYRARKFVRRHRVGVGASAAIVLSIGAGLTFALTGLVRAQRAEQRALDEATAARHVSDFLVQLFRVSDPNETRGNSVTARELLDRGADRITTQLDSVPTVQARLLRTMSQAYRELGLYDPALKLAEQALPRQRQQFGDSSVEVARSLNELASLHSRRGEYAKARDLGLQSLALQQRIFPTDSLAGVLNNLAIVYGQLGETDSARVMFERVLPIRERVLGPDHLTVHGALSNLAVVYGQLGRNGEAQPLLERAYAIARKHNGDEHVLVAGTLDNLANLHLAEGRLDTARVLSNRALAIREKILPPAHPLIATSLNNLGSILLEAGDVAGAKPLFERALDIRERSLGPNHTLVATALTNVGLARYALGEKSEARAPLERALRILEANVSPDHPNIPDVVLGLANIDAESGRYDAADRGYRRAISLIEGRLGSASRDLVPGLRDYAKFLRARGRVAEADSIQSRVTAVGRS